MSDPSVPERKPSGAYGGPNVAKWQAQFERETVELEGHNWRQVVAKALTMEHKRVGRTNRGALIRLQWMGQIEPETP